VREREDELRLSLHLELPSLQIVLLPSVRAKQASSIVAQRFFVCLVEAIEFVSVAACTLKFNVHRQIQISYIKVSH